jgi:hypothetical protein
MLGPLSLASEIAVPQAYAVDPAAYHQYHLPRYQVVRRLIGNEPCKINYLIIAYHQYHLYHRENVVPGVDFRLSRVGVAAAAPPHPAAMASPARRQP